MRLIRRFLFSVLLCWTCYAQQTNPPDSRIQRTPPRPETETLAEQPAPSQQQVPRTERTPEPATPSRPTPPGMQQQLPALAGEGIQAMRFDMTEVPPVQTHHQIAAGGRLLHYTATAGRLSLRTPRGRS